MINNNLIQDNLIQDNLIQDNLLEIDLNESFIINEQISNYIIIDSEEYRHLSFINFDVFVDFINSLQSNFASVLRTMSRKDELPEIFQEIQDHRAGNLIMELQEPSTKEEFLTREYLELRAKGIGLQDAIEMGTSGEFSDVNEYLKTFVMSQVSEITSKASRITGLRYQEDDVARKLSDVTMNTLNETIDNSLTELYYIYKG